MTSAAAVSAALRRAGFNPLGSGTSRMREGIRVGRGLRGTATVVVDLDMPNRARRLAVDVAEALAELGFAVEVNGDDSHIMTVSR